MYSKHPVLINPYSHYLWLAEIPCLKGIQYKWYFSGPSWLQKTGEPLYLTTALSEASVDSWLCC